MASILKAIIMAHQIIFGSETRPLKVGTFTISCFILDNHNRVFSLSSFQKALGYEGKHEQFLSELLNQIHRFRPIGELLDGLNQSPIFEFPATTSKNVAISPDFLLDVCRCLVLSNQQGFLNLNQLKHAKAAEKILKHVANVDLPLMIEEAAGLRFYKENTIERFSIFLSTMLEDDVFEWTRTIPEAFYIRIFELHQFNWADLNENPKSVGRILYDIIFSRIANDLLEELRTTKPKRNYRRKNQLPQDNQHPKLKEYLSNVLALIKAAGGHWNIFLQLLNRSYPKNELFLTKFPTLPAVAKSNTLSDFNQTLKMLS